MDVDFDVEMPMSRFPNVHCHHDWKASLSSSHNDPSDKPALFTGWRRGRNYAKSRFMLHNVNIPMSKVKDCRIKLKRSKKTFLSLKWVWKARSFFVKNKLRLNLLVLIKKEIMQETWPKGYRFVICSDLSFIKTDCWGKLQVFYYLKIIRF